MHMDHVYILDNGVNVDTKSKITLAVGYSLRCWGVINNTGGTVLHDATCYGEDGLVVRREALH